LRGSNRLLALGRVKKLALLLFSLLPACGWHELNVQLAQDAFDHAQAVCAARGRGPGTDRYAQCMLDHADGYVLTEADSGQVHFMFVPLGEGPARGVVGQGYGPAPIYRY
jgi:hypothetical protein